MFRLLRLPLRERPRTLNDEKLRERELQLFRHDNAFARRLVNMMVRVVVAILFAIGGVVVLSVLLDVLVKI
jgi:hypothetical protein